MEFTVYKKTDGYPVSLDEFVEVAKENGLMGCDLDKFMLTDSGTLVLADDCGNYMQIPREGKYLIDICLETQGTIVKIVY